MPCSYEAAIFQFLAINTVLPALVKRQQPGLPHSQNTNIILRVPGREVCYERLGCFTDDPPWSGIPGRELTGLPSPPAAVNTNFLLYTRDNTMKYQVRNWFALNIDSVLHGQQIIWTASFLPAEAPIHITHAMDSPSQFPFISFLFPHVSCLMGQV